jgi:hypothetical protein
MLGRPLHHLPTTHQPQPNPTTTHQTNRITLNKALLAARCLAHPEPTLSLLRYQRMLLKDMKPLDAAFLT